ncbi:MAG: hypothetical protein RMK30_03575 [Anaerolineae bacterium]|nr:hypothetical protein [Anaerolineae bacterium]MDW8101937.1 hypothetical protein [Anaerolineae bacterium]
MEYSRKEVLSRVVTSLKQQGKQSIAELVLSTRLPYGVIQEAIITLKERGIVKIERIMANPDQNTEIELLEAMDLIELNE